MKLSEKQSYLGSLKKRYKKANRKQKQKILDEFCETSGYNRKYVIHALGKRKTKHQPKKPGRRSLYNNERILMPLKVIWLASDL